MNCEHCQTLLLDHLYGLLESAEAASVDTHLATCNACADARLESARMQGLIARAAKNTFPNTRFEVPVVLAAKPRAARVAAILPWAVAAAVLIAIPGTVVPVLSMLNRAKVATRDANMAKLDADNATRDSAAAALQRESRINDAQMKLVTAEQTQTAVLNKWAVDQKAIEQAAVARKFTVDVMKPATVQPGAPNEFMLVVRDTRMEPRDKLIAEVRSSDAVLFTQALDSKTRGNTHAIRLPASVWAKVKPNAELSLVVAQVDEKTGTRSTLQEVRLAGPVFTTLLVTDKPAYRPGERLFFRSLTLDRVTLHPPTSEQVLQYELVSVATGRPVPQLSAIGTTDLVRVNDRVEPVRTADGQPVRGVGCGEFVLPTDLPDGDYTLVQRDLSLPGGFPATRSIKVRAGAVDHYAKRIGFATASYTSGEAVEAWAELKFQDKPLKEVEIAAVAVEADGVLLTGVEFAPKTGADGRAKLRFTLPGEVVYGDVRLRVVFRTPRGEEAVAERVPVVGRALIVEFFPESGDTLVAGVPCKVYVRATTPAGQPVDIRGIVTDGIQTLAKVETLADAAQPGANRGLAAFTFTPQLGSRAWLKLESPVHASAVAIMGGAGAVAARRSFALPEAKADGVAMSVPDAITAPGQPIRVHLHSVGKPRTLIVGAYLRGRLSDTQKVTIAAGQRAEVKLMAGTDPRGGVVRITAFEEAAPDLKPVAERLVFRKPGERLNLAFALSPQVGAPATCAITATDEKNNPVAAVLWASVVNTGVAPGAKDRTMPTHFLLAGEVKNPDDLEYADFLLTDHPKAGEALDLVLGTQGWRRFAEQSPRVARNPELARLANQNGQQQMFLEPLATRELRAVTEKYSPLYETTRNAVARARDSLEFAYADSTEAPTARMLAATAAATARTASEKQSRAEAAREPVRRFRSAAWFGIFGFAAFALACGGIALARPKTRLPLGFSTFGSVGLSAFLFAALSWGDEARAFDNSNAQPAAAPKDVGALATAPAPRLKIEVPRESMGRNVTNSNAVQMKSMTTDKSAGADVAKAAMPSARIMGTPSIAPFAGGAEAKSVPRPVAPLATPPAPRVAIADGLGGVPLLPNEVFAANATSPVVGRAFQDPDAADALKKVSDRAAKFATDRADLFAQSLGDEFAAIRGAINGIPPLVVREYAAPRPTSSETALPDIILWQPVIVLPSNGKATLTFHLGTAPGGYRVLIAGHTADGRLGEVRGTILVAPTPTVVPTAP